MNLDLTDLLNHAEEAFLMPCRKDGAVDLFAKNSAGDTLLHVAAGWDRLDEMRYLLDQGLNINARGDYLETPLHVAGGLGNSEMFKFLLSRGADRSIPNYAGTLPQDPSE